MRVRGNWESTFPRITSEIRHIGEQNTESMPPGTAGSVAWLEPRGRGGGVDPLRSSRTRAYAFRNARRKIRLEVAEMSAGRPVESEVDAALREAMILASDGI